MPRYLSVISREQPRIEATVGVTLFGGSEETVEVKARLEVEAAEATNHTCRAEVWHCMSGVMETGIKYVERPDDIYR